MCPNCSMDDSRVIYSNHSPNGVKRRRECKCGCRFNTLEINEDKYKELWALQYRTDLQDALDKALKALRDMNEMLGGCNG